MNPIFSLWLLFRRILFSLAVLVLTVIPLHAGDLSTDDYATLSLTLSSKDSDLLEMLRNIEKQGSLPCQIQEAFPERTFLQTSLGKFLSSQSSQDVISNMQKSWVRVSHSPLVLLSDKEVITECAVSMSAWYDALLERLPETARLSDINLMSDDGSSSCQNASALRCVAVACLIEGLNALWRGRWNDTVSAVDYIDHIGVLLERQQGVGMHISAVWVYSLVPIIAQEASKIVETPAWCLEQLRARLVKRIEEAEPAILRDVLRFERASGICIFERVRREGGKFLGIPQEGSHDIDADEKFYLRFMDGLISDCDKPVYDLQQQARLIDEAFCLAERTYPVSYKVMPRFFNSQSREYALYKRELMVAIIALNCRLRQVENRNRRDPVTGAMLVVVQGEDGFEIVLNREDVNHNETLLRIKLSSSRMGMNRDQPENK